MQQSISLSNRGRPSTPNLAGHANQEISSPLIGVSRPLSIDDVRVFQNAFARHDTEQEQSGLQATFNDFYAVCVGPKAPNQTTVYFRRPG